MMIQTFPPNSMCEDSKNKDYWVRRRKNNEAARRSREKRRMNDLLLERRVLQLSEENKQLRAQLVALKIKYGDTEDLGCYTWPEDTNNDSNFIDTFGSQQLDSCTNINESKNNSWKTSMSSNLSLLPIQRQFSSRVFTNATGDTSATVLVNESVMSNSTTNFPMLHLDQCVPYCLPPEDTIPSLNPSGTLKDRPYSFPKDDDAKKLLREEELAEEKEERTDNSESFARLNSLLRKTFPPTVAIALGALYSRYSGGTVASQATADYLLQDVGTRPTDDDTVGPQTGKSDFLQKLEMQNEKNGLADTLRHGLDSFEFLKENAKKLSEIEPHSDRPQRKDNSPNLEKDRESNASLKSSNRLCESLRKPENAATDNANVRRDVGENVGAQKRKSSFQLPHKLRLKKASIQQESFDEEEEDNVPDLTTPITKSRSAVLPEIDNASKFRRFSYSDQESMRRLHYKEKDFPFFSSAINSRAGYENNVENPRKRNKSFIWPESPDAIDFSAKFGPLPMSLSLDALHGLSRDKISIPPFSNHWLASGKHTHQGHERSNIFPRIPGKDAYPDYFRAKEHGRSMYHTSKSLSDPLVAM
uniref:Transcription factor protein n=1 Tax=Ciona intestinalis TaxID=7719 RepID=Q4H349_CIOIN|nr:transcription factor protein [Ciona intestinalis]BAE06578.1 transcription factor protein [Ciona intestinalis]|eukprot:NP_001071771.1 transcription factor protein [Ciona intestinalis]